MGFLNPIAEAMTANSPLGTLLPQSASPKQYKVTKALQKPLGRRYFERMSNISCPTGCQASPVLSHTNTKPHRATSSPVTCLCRTCKFSFQKAFTVPNSRLWDQVCKQDSCLFSLVSVQCRTPTCRVHTGEIIGISQQNHKIIPYCFCHGAHNQSHIAKLAVFYTAPGKKLTWGKPQH